MYLFVYSYWLSLDNLKNDLSGDFDPVKDRVCSSTLKGYQRIWNLAIDNSKTLTNSEYFMEKRDNYLIRPDCFVAYPNIERKRSAEVRGLLIKLDKKKDLKAKRNQEELLTL